MPDGWVLDLDLVPALSLVALALVTTGTVLMRLLRPDARQTEVIGVVAISIVVAVVIGYPVAWLVALGSGFE